MSTSAPIPATPVPAPAGPLAPVAAAAVAGAEAPAAAIAVSGQALPVTQGQALAARVIAVQAGMVELALAGGLVTAASDLPLEPGQTLRLIVAEAGTDRVSLRIAPETSAQTTAQAGAPSPQIGPADALARAGVPASAASALLAALAEQGAELPTGAAATALAARAADAGVGTPSEAAAFARLVVAGLPTGQTAVAGLAQLMEGAPLGRALTTVLDAAVATVAAQTAEATAAGDPPGLLAGMPGAPRPGAPAAAGVGAAAIALFGETAPAAGGAAPPGAAPATPPGTPPTAPTTPMAHAQPLAGLVASHADLARSIEAGSVDGHSQALRHALADLGVGLEARLAAGSPPDRAPLRALLLALAEHPGTDASLARAAAGLSDALTAQSLVGPALAASTAGGSGGAGGQAADASAQNGAYLQLPLPGGGTAEVRVSPDGGREGTEGGDRPRKLAFLLHLSALGPVMIEASAGAAAVDATIRVGSDEVRRFLGTQAGELAEALRRSAPAASVSVERLAGPPPERLVAPPPSSGLDLSA